MKTLVEYIREQTSSSNLYSNRGWRVIATKHSRERFSDRLSSDFNLFDLQDIIERGMYILTTKSPKKKQSFLVYSKLINRAIVLSYEGSKQFNIITILPKGKQTAKIGTDKIVVEQYLNESLCIDDHDDGYKLIDFNTKDIKISILDNKVYEMDVNIVVID